MTDLYWHFARTVENPDTGILEPRLGNNDERLIVEGETLRATAAPIQICDYGMHASIAALDALAYAGNANRYNHICLTRVTLGEIFASHSDKVVSDERTVIKMLPVAQTTDLLVSFALWSANQVIDLWRSAPVTLKRFLQGDDSLAGEAYRMASRRRPVTHYNSSRLQSTNALATWSVYYAVAAFYDAKRSTLKPPIKESANMAVRAAIKTLRKAHHYQSQCKKAYDIVLGEEVSAFFRNEFERRCLEAIGETG